MPLIPTRRQRILGLQNVLILEIQQNIKCFTAKNDYTSILFKLLKFMPLNIIIDNNEIIEDSIYSVLLDTGVKNLILPLDTSYQYFI